MAEIRPRSVASSWPRSGAARRLRRGRGQVQLGGFVSVVFFWGRQDWGLGIPQPIRGCRIGCRYPRVCAWVRGSSGQGAWHPPALPWVPYRLPVSSRLSGASGVHGARGLASLGPFLGAKAGCRVRLGVLSWLVCFFLFSDLSTCFVSAFSREISRWFSSGGLCL